MMDFEMMGTMMGAKAAIDRTRQEATQRIAGRDEEIEKLNRELATYKAALLAERAHSAGLMAQFTQLRANLLSKDPNNGLFRKVGRILVKTGAAVTVLRDIYNAEHDRVAMSLGVSASDAKKLRGEER